MRTLYQPLGHAAAYAKLAVNIYHECSHGCRYCYCPRCLRRTPRAFFNREPAPRQGLLAILPHHCEEWAKVTDERPPVHLSFIGDPLPIGGDHTVANEVIHILHRFLFPVQILSKSGVLEPDTLKELNEHDSYGITLTAIDPKAVEYWEPFAGPVGQRINAMGRAQEAGVKTWVSLEPVISLNDARGVLYALQGCSCDPVWIGPLNHLGRDYDWQQVKGELAALAAKVGLPVRWKDEACLTRRGT